MTMKHLDELWQTVAAFTTPSPETTREELQEMFEAADQYIDEKIRRSSMITLDDAADSLAASMSNVARRLVTSISSMEIDEQDAAARRAREMAAQVFEQAITDALQALAKKSGRNGQTARH